MSNSPATARLYHLDGEIDPHLGRQAKVLRRNRWRILIVTVVGALVFGLLSQGKAHQASVTLRLPSAAPDLEAMSVPLSSLIGTIDGRSIEEALDQVEVKKAAETAAGRKIDVTVSNVLGAPSPIVTVTVSSSDASSTAKALDYYAAEYRMYVLERVVVSVDSLSKVNLARRESGAARVIELETQLAAGDLGDPLVEVIESELVGVQTELRFLSDQAGALDDFATRRFGEVSISKVEEVGGGPVPFVAGGLLGGLAALLMTLGISFLDKKALDRGSLESPFAGPVLAVLSMDTPSHLDTLVTTLTNRLEPGRLVLVPVDRGHASSDAQEISAGLADRRFSPELIEPPQFGMSSPTTDEDVNYVLVVAAAKTALADFTLAATTLNDIGRPAAGTVLVTRTLAEYRDAAS